MPYCSNFVQAVPFKSVYDGSQSYGSHYDMPLIEANTIELNDLVVLECRMGRRDIPSERPDLSRWTTYLELMTVILLSKHDT